MARLANLRRLRAGRMIVLEFAGIRGRLRSLGVHRNQFGFEFTQKLLAFVVLVRDCCPTTLPAGCRSLRGGAVSLLLWGTWPAAIRITGATRSLPWHVG